MGARSIFTYDNVEFMNEFTKEDSFFVVGCEEAIDDLLEVLRRSYIDKRNMD